MKEYIFNNQSYTDSNSLALAFVNDYKLAMQDIYDKYKKIASFAKTTRKDKKDKKIGLRIRNYLAYSKSKNSALTFVIFELLDEKAVYINGTKLSFPDFCLNLKQTRDNKNNVLIDFLSDGGIENTYAKMGEYESLKEDARFLDRNANDSGTIDYISNYYNTDSESYHELLDNVLMGNERFRRFNRLLKEPGFVTYLSHKYAFKSFSKALTDSNKVFGVCKALGRSSDYTRVSLLSVFDDVFYIWFLDNIKNYKFKKSEGKEIRKRFNKYRKEYKSLLAKANSKGLDTRLKKKEERTYFDLLMDFHNKVLGEYQYLTRLYQSGLVIPKSDNLKFELPYANSLVPRRYAEGRSLTLAEAREYHTEYVDLEDTSCDFPDMANAKKTLYDMDKYQLSKRMQRRNSTLVVFSVVFGILLAIITVTTPILLIAFGNMDFVKNIYPNHEFKFEELRPFITISGGLVIMTLIACIILSIRSNKTSQIASNLLFMQSCNENYQNLTPAQKSKLERIQANSYYTDQRAKYGHRLLSLSVVLLHSLQVSIFAYTALYLASLNTSVNAAIKPFTPTMSGMLLTLFAGPVLTSLLLFFKKVKNNWLLLLLDLVNMGIVYAFTQYVFK